MTGMTGMTGDDNEGLGLTAMTRDDWMIKDD